LNLLASPEVARSNPGGKCQEEPLLGLLGHSPEVGVDGDRCTVGGPPGPARRSGLVVHCSRLEGLPRSVDITLESSSGVGCTSCQESFCERGKRELKYDKK
jgi:hypothetical protein